MFRCVYSWRASQFRTKIRSRFQIDTVSPFTRPMKPCPFENVPLLTVFSKQPDFDLGLKRRCVDERRNSIKGNAVTNETASACA